MKFTLLAALLMSACAHSASKCPTATEALSDRYVVIECWNYTYPDTKEVVPKCLVIDRAGREYEKVVFHPTCGL